MKKTLKCDLCDYTAEGENFEEWMSNLRPHYLDNHADVMNDPNRGPADMQKWMEENRKRFDHA